MAVMMTHQKWEFARRYCDDFIGIKAAMAAGVAEKNAATQAWRWLSDAEVQKAIADIQAERAAAAGISAEWVLRQWKQIAEADPNDLISLERECCRHCYGANHNYQWTQFEYDLAVKNAAAHRCTSKCEPDCAKRFPPLPLGGMNFNPRLVPREDCPVCFGEGIAKVIVADTRRLQGDAKKLYAGVKQTQNGIEVKMRDQDAAINNIARYLGMIIDKRELSGPNGKAIPFANFTAKDLTDDQLAQIILQDEPEP